MFKRYNKDSKTVMVWIEYPEITIHVHYPNESNEYVHLSANNFGTGHESCNVNDIPNNRQAKREAIARMLKALAILEGKCL